MDLFVHDGLVCHCGKSRCGVIAGSDHSFVSATLDLHRPPDSLLTPRWSWNKGINWSDTLNGCKVHFELLASWINLQTRDTRCANRDERQAIVNCISFAWYVITYGALANVGKWRLPVPNSARKPFHWWNPTCDKAAAHIFQCKNTCDEIAARAHYRSTPQQAKRSHQARLRT